MNRLAISVGWLFVVACHSAPPAPDSALTATADFLNDRGESVGRGTLTQTDRGVKIDIRLSRLPAGTHALHIHNVGQCHATEEKAFTSSGPHFNPFNKKHGTANPEGPHAGDLPNFEAGADGTARISFVAERVTLQKGEKHSLFPPGGTCLMIHEKADDGKTDPTGNTGSRIACGIIKK